MKYKMYRVLAVFLCLNLTVDVLAPTMALALTGGPAQPEMNGFQQIGVSDMVDLKTGDFSYNIPLLDVGGYPLNLVYNGSPSMDDEASWVGLGWSLNPGAVNRIMKGLPDDFKGDEIKKTKHMKPDITVSATFKKEKEIFGFELGKLKEVVEGQGQGNASGSITVSYNNYTGMDVGLSLGASTSATSKGFPDITGGLSLSSSANSGLDLAPRLGLSLKSKKVSEGEENIARTSVGVGLGFNSRHGLKSLTLNGGIGWKSSDKALKNVKEAGNLSGGFHHDFIMPQRLPYEDDQMNSAGGSFMFEWGTFPPTAVYTPKLNVTVAYNQVTLDKNGEEKSRKGYGAMHSSVPGITSENALMDFNREKDGAVGPNTPNLAIPVYTYDLFNFTGQGMSQQFKVTKQDMGVLHDPYSAAGTTSVNVGVGLEVGVTAPNVHVGIDLGANWTRNEQGGWNHNQYGNFNFEKQPYLASSENVARFIPSGITNKYSAYKFNLKKKGNKIDLGDSYSEKDLIEPIHYQNTNLVYLTADEARFHGSTIRSSSILEKSLPSYPVNTNPAQATPEYLSRVDGNKKGHHLSEMIVTREDGARYIYGIPVYTTTTKEVSFNISQGVTVDYNKGMVAYTPGVDNVPSNKNGLDHFYESQTTPAYAHSYLLTTVLSSDYGDRTDDGPSTDDFGSYTKFNYSRTTDSYKWRVPLAENKANHSEGLKGINNFSSRSDDKGNYLYGEKELWFLHSVETKTHIALFELSNRTDGKPAVGENGGVELSNNSNKCLSKITLYSKSDLTTPIKVVHFNYNNSLCPGIDNGPANTGKLTLAEVYFTYGTSNKGKFSAYKFSYTNNYPYNIKAYDRWGMYKPNLAGFNDNPLNAVLSNGEYPYAVQTDERDQHVAAWTLNKIELPSGGVINVEYESDDYAFVQDKPAMEMFKTLGACKNEDFIESADLKKLKDGSQQQNFVFFYLKKPIVAASEEEADNIFRTKYLRNMEYMYFRFLVNLSNGLFEDYEYISGYTPIVSSGVKRINHSDYNIGYVELKGSGIRANESGAEVNPVTKTAWQYARLNRPEIAYGLPIKDPDNFGEFEGVKSIVEGILANVQNLVQTFVGINSAMDANKYGHIFNPDKSWIRLYTPDGHKAGGSHRVKKITIADSWDVLTNSLGAPSVYGQEYSYETQENGETISSGVATYEPLLGNEENTLKQPVFFDANKLLVPDDHFFQEGPFGESFFPSPEVIYSKVKVSSINNAVSSVSSTGYVENEFYTSRDFPVITERTTPQMLKHPKRRIFKFLKIKNKDFRGFSQGYYIELNDMAGKPRSQSVYDKSNRLLSSVRYNYQVGTRTRVYETLTGQDNAGINNLNNRVNALIYKPEAGNTIQQVTLGEEYDHYSDSRMTYTKNKSIGGNFNLDLLTYPVMFILALIPLIPFNEEQLKVNIITNVRVVSKTGVLSSVTAYEDGSEVTTENLLYDPQTGQVLLTKTTNQFGDPVYNFTYPAYYAYDQMGHSYRNAGYRFESLQVSNFTGAVVPPAEVLSNFVDGDEIGLKSASGGIYKAWVAQRSNSGFILVDRNYDAIPGGSYSGIILRSGRRNMQSTPIGSVTTLENPMKDNDGNGAPDALSFSSILNASAVEFADSWKTYCECATNFNSSKFNPYIYGTRGNWRVQKSYAYLTERTQDVKNNNTNIRTDGVFKSYNAFWNPPANNNGVWTKNATNWQFVTEVTSYSPNGYELENKDALGRFSSATYGYYAMLPVAVHNNSMYAESVSESYEDYYLLDCMVGRKLSFEAYKNSSPDGAVSTQQSHTGRYSMKVNPEKMVKSRTVLGCPY